MKQIDKIVKSQSEPKDINVLWLDTSNPGELTLKEYDGGEWRLVAGGGGDDSGSSEDAIKYTEQTLTETQQMQARENQGLYASKNVDSTFVTFTAKEVPTEYDDVITGNDIRSGNEVVWVKVGDCDRVPITSPLKVTIQKDELESESYLYNYYLQTEGSDIEYTKDAVMSEGGFEGSVWDNVQFEVAFLNNPSSVGFPLKEFAGKKGIYCNFTDFLSEVPAGASLSIELLPTISYDGNYADKDYLEFTLPIEDSEEEVVMTLRLIKVADGPIDMFDRSVTAELDGESFSYSGIAHSPNYEGSFELISEHTYQVPVGHCLFGDDVEESGMPILVGGEALGVEDGGSEVQFFIFSNAVISGTDSKPRTGVYVFSQEYDSVSFVTISPITEISYLPYEEIYNKIDPKYIDGEVSSGGTFDVEFTYDEDREEWQCNHTLDEIIEAINAGKVIRATLPLSAGQGMAFTTDFVLEYGQDI